LQNNGSTAVEMAHDAPTVAHRKIMILKYFSFQNLVLGQVSMIKNTSTKLKIGLTCDYPGGYPKTTPKYL